MEQFEEALRLKPDFAAARKKMTMASTSQQLFSALKSPKNAGSHVFLSKSPKSIRSRRWDSGGYHIDLHLRELGDFEPLALLP
jgi:hypothetical protein